MAFLWRDGLTQHVIQLNFPSCLDSIIGTMAQVSE